jgi:transcription antitermination factor NusG
MMVTPNLELWDQVRWYALHARSRHEKLVAEELQKKGIETFLPLRRITRHWSDRVKKIDLPLFSGYLFVHIPLKERLEVLQTRGSVRLVGFHSLPVPVSEKELDAVRRFVEEEISMDPFPYLAEGDRVYIRSGPLKGVEGFIVRKDKHTRLVISLDLLLQSISVEIDEALVEKI